MLFLEMSLTFLSLVAAPSILVGSFFSMCSAVFFFDDYQRALVVDGPGPDYRVVYSSFP